MRIGFVDRRSAGSAGETEVPYVRALALPRVVKGSAGFDAFLERTDRGLVFRLAGAGRPGPIGVDFVERVSIARGGSGGGRELLARAVGARHGRRPMVVDATAGLGRDAAMLARFGCKVTAIERSPIVVALLRDGQERALAHEKTQPALRDRLAIVQADARRWLSSLAEGERPDVVYLDPMYTEPGRGSAAARKELQILRRLLGNDEDAGELFTVAMRVAGERVVVKRQQHAPPLGGPPSITFTGRSTRYDVYLRIDADRMTDGERG